MTIASKSASEMRASWGRSVLLWGQSDDSAEVRGFAHRFDEVTSYRRRTLHCSGWSPHYVVSTWVRAHAQGEEV